MNTAMAVHSLKLLGGGGGQVRGSEGHPAAADDLASEKRHLLAKRTLLPGGSCPPPPLGTALSLLVAFPPFLDFTAQKWVMVALLPIQTENIEKEQTNVRVRHSFLRANKILICIVVTFRRKPIKDPIEIDPMCSPA